ncbi:MAG: hypothetical protein KGL13_08455 [Gammaproteobacteria bacterium]|nr:hypothetical protein [Gammaproteobacteria bacterium]MDE2346485.1 hypothetical protein [Gammaproteobacteria bacterium]
MTRNYPLLILLSVVAVVVAVVGSLVKQSGMPFSFTVLDARTAVISPIHGLSLPANLRAGDRIDLPLLDHQARIALAQANLPAGHRYDINVRRGAAEFTVPVTAVDLDSAYDEAWIVWSLRSLAVLSGVIVLLVLWRGRDRASRYMVLWTMSFMVGNAFFTLPSDGLVGISATVVGWLSFLSARIGFYLLVETVLGSILTPRLRMGFRTLFVFSLLAGASVFPTGQILFVATGWAELLRPGYGYLLFAGYLIPFVMLTVGFGMAETPQRLKLRWMLWSSIVFLFGVCMGDTIALGLIPSVIANYLCEFLGLAGFVYAVLRHRLVDVSLIIDRTLVYGGVTALVVGVIAAMNSLALRATLGPGASLLLQVVVPLALGIVLHRVRTYMDMVVERVFFRSKYLAEKTLKNFGRHCGHIESLQRLLDISMEEFQRFTRSPALAMYEATGQGYRRLRAAGKSGYPEMLDRDDPAIVAVRAEDNAMELADYRSALGAEGCIFPISVLGRLRGVLVCANRPGEHFAPDEKKLLAEVIREVGAAWRILRARENEEVLRALADGRLEPSAARDRAQQMFSEMGSAALQSA